MNQQNTGEPKPRALDVLNHLIKMTEARLVDRIDRLNDPAVYEESITEAVRVLVVYQQALGRLTDERDLLSPLEALV